MEAQRRSYVEVVSNGKPEGVGKKTPSAPPTHQDLGTQLVLAVSDQEVNGQRFVVRMNEEISRESLYFPGEDCRPVWHSRYTGCQGSSSSSKGAGESGEASEFGRAIIPNPSKILAIRISIGEERACGNNTAEKCKRAARRNDDTVVHCLRSNVDRGGRSRETEGLVETEELVGTQEIINAGVESLIYKATNKRNVQFDNLVSPCILPREIDVSLVGLGSGPVCRLSEEDVGPSCAPGHPFNCSK
ncbi:hypothetical protein Ancab_006666 [Ancistrocladus abbreviatus]